MSTTSFAGPDPVRLGEWVLGRELGRGAFGVVYMATSAVTSERRAVKLLHERFEHSTEVVERFRREARLLAELDHPAICRCEGVFREDDRWFLVLELLEGTVLSKYEPRDLVPARLMAWFRAAADGLAQAHRQKIVHRDIKPENLFVVAADQSLHILDFGVARAMHDAGAALTQVGAIMGTRPYIAPEVWLGDPGDWRPADVYALGVTFFQLYEGIHPFASRFEVNRAPGEREPDWKEIHTRRAAHAMRGAPPAIADLLARMLAREPSARPDATAVCAALSAGESITITAATLGRGREPAGVEEVRPGARAASAPAGGDALPRAAFTPGRAGALGDGLAEILTAVVDAARHPQAAPSEPGLTDYVRRLEAGYAPFLATLVTDLEAVLDPEGANGGLSAHFLVRGPTPDAGDSVRVAARSNGIPRKVYDLRSDARTVPFPPVREALKRGLSHPMEAVPDVAAAVARGGRWHCPRFEKQYRDDLRLQERYGSVLVMCLQFRSELVVPIPGWGSDGGGTPSDVTPRRADAVLCVECPRSGRWDREMGQRLASVAVPYMVVLSRSLLVYALAGEVSSLWRFGRAS